MKITQEEVREGLRRARYITVPRVETAIYVALVLEKPLLVEGPAGAGKTEIAKVVAAMLETELVRLQCYEGLDEARALYEWNYQKQLHPLIRGGPGDGKALAKPAHRAGALGPSGIEGLFAERLEGYSAPPSSVPA